MLKSIDDEHKYTNVDSAKKRVNLFLRYIGGYIWNGL